MDQEKEKAGISRPFLLMSKKQIEPAKG